MTNPTDQLNPEQTWSRALDQLQLQMTQATFDMWLKDTWLVSAENGSWQVGVKSESAIDWLENRLKATIDRTVADIAGHPIELTYLVAKDSPQPLTPPTPLPAPNGQEIHPSSLIPHPSSLIPHPSELSPGQKLAQADPYEAHFVKGGAGFMMVSNYQNVYWLAYLGGEAFALWQRLANEKTTTVKKVEDRWTEKHRYSYTELAGWLNLSHSCYISGCIRECHNSRLHVAQHGKQIPQCCRNHAPVARVKIDNQRRERCMFWRTGLLQILRRESLVAIKEIKARKKSPRAHVLEIQCWRVLPPLTPAQVAQLPPNLQKAHDLWIESWGPKLYEVSLSDWRKISEDSIVPAMTGYDEYRELDGPYFPDEHFYRLKRQEFYES